MTETAAWHRAITSWATFGSEGEHGRVFLAFGAGHG